LLFNPTNRRLPAIRLAAEFRLKCALGYRLIKPTIIDPIHAPPLVRQQGLDHRSTQSPSDQTAPSQPFPMRTL